MLKAIPILIAGLVATGGAKAETDVASKFAELLGRSELAHAMYFTCIKHAVETDDLEAYLNSSKGFMPYGEADAKDFLLGYQGKAWGFGGHQSAYVVTHSSNGICAVNAQHADRSKAADDLKELLDILYNGHAVPMPPYANGTAHSDEPPVVGWSVNHDQAKKTYSFTVVVGKGDNPPAEAVYSVLVTNEVAPP